MIEFNNTFNAILGNAGTGKSHTIKNLKRTLLLASTGIAAINLGKGRTINSALGYFDTKDMLHRVDDGAILPLLIDISKQYHTIAVDEVSMYPGEQVDLLCHSIEEHNKYIRRFNSYKDNYDLKLLLVGDPAQLPPVSMGHNPAKPFFKAIYWNQFNVTYLTEVKRQADREFIDVLNKIRIGRVKEVVDWFDSNIGFSKEVDKYFIGSTFFPTNKEVNVLNSIKLKEIEAREVVFINYRNGAQLLEWKDIPDKITVKVGMKVMLLSNNFETNYANGDLGTVLETVAEGVLVRLQRTGNEVLVKYKTLENVIICHNPKNDTDFPNIIGTIKYLPIRQGDASTIHKSQGLSLDNVQVSVIHPFLSRLSGGLYTALSRVKSSEGLRIVGSKDQFIKACYVDPSYLNFLLDLERQAELQMAA